MVYVCSTCAAQIQSIAGFCAHLRIVHSNSYSSTFKCCHCPKIYDTIKCLRQHLIKQHPENNLEVADNVPNDNEIPIELEPDLPLGDLENNVVPEAQAVSVVDFKVALYDSTLSLASKLYSIPSLNRIQVQNILKIASDYISSGFLDVLKSKTMSILGNDFNGTQEDLQHLNEMFASIQDPLEGLRTETQRLIALEQSHAYIPPTPFYIGEDEVLKMVNGVKIRTPIELTGQYICMKTVLKYFLELPGVYDTVITNIQNLRDSNQFSNIIQGPLWQQILDKFENRIVLPLILYFDDAEPDNQSGSHSGNHSLGLLYYFIACLPQYLLSSLENIFVASVFLTNDQKRRNEETFRIVVNDLKELETDGIEIEVGNNVYQVYFSVVLIIGDNKGINGITGYVESFTANHYCRICKDFRDVARWQTVENPNTLRNPINYAQDLLVNDVSLTGIKRKCIWNELMSYHCTVNIATEIMHDFFEGVCHYDLSIVLLHLIDQDYFSIDTLNDRVQYFDFGLDSGNRISLITMDHLRKEKFKMSASEMYCFVRHLGLIIGDLVPEDNEFWRLYLLLVQILDIIASPSFGRNVSPYLAALISEHHSLYINLSGTWLKPKFHLMLHICRVLALLGPLFHVCCMRLEAKHRPVVKIPARSHSCRKNMPLSTAKRYSLSLAARFLAGQGFPPKVQFCSIELILSETEDFDNFRVILPENYHNSICMKRVTICGTEYRQSHCLAFKIEEDLPIFGSIVWIVRPQEPNAMPFFLLSVMQTIGHNDHLHCYEVQSTNEWFFVNYDQLLSFYPTTSRIGADGHSYVTFRHSL